MDQSKQVKENRLLLSPVNRNLLIVPLGIYVCATGSESGQCLASSASGAVPNVTTTFTISSYIASSINSAQNNTILSVFNLATHKSAPLTDLSALGLGVGWLLNYTAANLPVQSSPVFQFTETGSEAYQAIWQESSYEMLKSIIGFILWEFTMNNNGNPDVANTEPNGQTPNLPAEFQTTASICQPFARFVVDKRSFIAYLAIQAAAILFCWVVVVWGCVVRERMPETSAYPIVDFGAKLRHTQSIDHKLFPGLGKEHGSKATRHHLRGLRVTTRYEEKPENTGLIVNEEHVEVPKTERRD